MKLKILGSGGCVSTPRPCCSCSVCREAREKGFPYARTGCCLYIEDANLLIDTPEDVNDALNHGNVEAVDTILYSHADPDHTMGIRVIEQLRMNWLNRSLNISMKNPVTVASLPQIAGDLKQQSTKYGSMLDYYEACGLAKVTGTDLIDSGSLRIQLVPVNDSNTVAVFVISENDHKVIYAPCDAKPFPESSLFEDADLLIIGNTIVGETLKDGFLLKNDNPLRDELFVMEEIITLKEKYHIKEMIVTHLEEDWGKSYTDYLKLEKEYDSIRFAYDGMEIQYGI